jgi:hypothetical protein
MRRLATLRVPSSKTRPVRRNSRTPCSSEERPHSFYLVTPLNEFREDLEVLSSLFLFSLYSSAFHRQLLGIFVLDVSFFPLVPTPAHRIQPIFCRPYSFTLAQRPHVPSLAPSASHPPLQKSPQPNPARTQRTAYTTTSIVYFLPH